MSERCNRCFSLECRINGLLKDLREANGEIARLKKERPCPAEVEGLKVIIAINDLEKKQLLARMKNMKSEMRKSAELMEKCLEFLESEQQEGGR